MTLIYNSPDVHLGGVTYGGYSDTFETYIDVNFRNALSYWQRTETPEDVLLLPKETSSRLVKLIDSNLLPDIKRSQHGDIIIRKGILVELYRCGVTSEQLPNLNALADYMKARFRKAHGNKVVNCHWDTTSRIF